MSIILSVIGVVALGIATIFRDGFYPDGGRVAGAILGGSFMIAGGLWEIAGRIGKVNLKEFEEVNLEEFEEE